MSDPNPVNERRLNPVDGLFRRLAFRLLPPRCLLCREAGSAGRELCLRCADELPWNQRACARCALPIEGAGTLCSLCQRRTPPFARLIAPLRYGYPLDRLVTRFKFNQDLAAGALLADLLAGAVARAELPSIDLLAPVPLHVKRLRERGYNQSLELARRIAPTLRTRVATDALTRTRATEVQSGLDAKARRQNVRDAFAADAARVRELHVALVDDVVTTGATVHECTKALLRAGAREVSVFAVARAPARSVADG